MNNHVSFVYMIQYKSSQGDWFFSVIEPNRYNTFEEAEAAAVDLSQSTQLSLVYRVVGFRLVAIYAEIM